MYVNTDGSNTIMISTSVVIQHVQNNSGLLKTLFITRKKLF